MNDARAVHVLRSRLGGEPGEAVAPVEQAEAEQVVIGGGQGVGRNVAHGASERRRGAVVNQAICRFCSASSSSWNEGMCSVGAILRPVSTETCGALPCRWATSTARITS